MAHARPETIGISYFVPLLVKVISNLSPVALGAADGNGPATEELPLAEAYTRVPCWLFTSSQVSSPS